MKNIAIITTSLNGGGAERIAGLLSKELSNRYNVFLFLLSTDNIVYEYGGTIVDIGYLGLPFYESAILESKERYRIDVAISFLEIMNFANIRTKRTEKVIISERCVQSLFEKKMDAQTLKIRRYYNYADEIVSCSYGVKYDLEKNFQVQSNIDIIYNFIDKAMIANKAEADFDAEIADFVGNDEFFLNVGRLDPQKNQIELVRQFAKFHKVYGNVKLVILGSGELREKINTIIEENGLGEHVRIFSYLSNPFTYMKHAKALILSSRFEGLPNTILEAMCVGCPIVATDCLSGPRELLGGLVDYDVPIEQLQVMDRGIIIPFLYNKNQMDTCSLQEAMEMIMERPDLVRRMIDQEKIYMEQYSNDKILSRWIDLIEKENISNAGRCVSEMPMDRSGPVLIYGAGKIGKAIYLSIKDKIDVSGFVVSKKMDDEETYMNLPVYQIDELPKGYCDAQFILGTIEETQNEIVNALFENGYYNIIDPIIEPTKEAIKNYQLN